MIFLCLIHHRIIFYWYFFPALLHFLRNNLYKIFLTWDEGCNRFTCMSKIRKSSKYQILIFNNFMNLDWFLNIEKSLSMLDWLTNQHQKSASFISFSCWLHCHSMEDFFLSSCCGGGAKAFLKMLRGSHPFLFSSASLGRKSSFSTCRRINIIY